MAPTVSSQIYERVIINSIFFKQRTNPKIERLFQQTYFQFLRWSDEICSVEVVIILSRPRLSDEAEPAVLYPSEINHDLQLNDLTADTFFVN